MNREKGSIYNFDTVTNTPGSKVFNKKNVYYLRVINPSDFEVRFTSRQTGDFIVRAKSDIIFPSFPGYTFDVNVKAKFTVGHDENSFCEIITMLTYEHSGKCQD